MTDKRELGIVKGSSLMYEVESTEVIDGETVEIIHEVLPDGRLGPKGRVRWLNLDDPKAVDELKRAMPDDPKAVDEAVETWKKRHGAQKQDL